MTLDFLPHFIGLLLSSYLKIASFLVLRVSFPSICVYAYKVEITKQRCLSVSVNSTATPRSFRSFAFKALPWQQKSARGLCVPFATVSQIVIAVPIYFEAPGTENDRPGCSRGRCHPSN